MIKAESAIALGLMGLAAYFMWHATVLPIGWVEGSGPGGGAFPFWLSAVMLVCAGAVLVRSLSADAPRGSFFVPATFRPVLMVIAALGLTAVLMPILGTYIAIPAFLIWYLRFFGGHSWAVTAGVVAGFVAILFFFFEVTAKVLMPKGITEPLFLPLYAIFF
jgi:hypothetical protein